MQKELSVACSFFSAFVNALCMAELTFRVSEMQRRIDYAPSFGKELLTRPSWQGILYNQINFILVTWLRDGAISSLE